MIDTLRELQPSISRVLTNAPTGMTIAHKQLVLIVFLAGLIKAYPAEPLTQNNLAVLATILRGSRLLTAVSTTVRPDLVQ